MGPALTIAAAGGLTIVGTIARGKAPLPRVFVGIVIAGGGVLAIAQYSPEIAAKLSAVVFLTALLTSGYDVATGAQRALSVKPSAAITPPTK